MSAAKTCAITGVSAELAKLLPRSGVYWGDIADQSFDHPEINSAIAAHLGLVKNVWLPPEFEMRKQWAKEDPDWLEEQLIDIAAASRQWRSQ